MSTGALRPPAATRGRGIATRWRVAGALALPFLIAVAALRGLTATMPTYHGGDEWTYHLPTVRQFGEQLPWIDLADYPAAQTPLYHLLVALWGEVAGYEMWTLRIVGVVCSWLAALVLYRLLRRETGLGAVPATAVAIVFSLSPYVFGQSFILGTDNPGLLLCLLAVERLAAFRRGAGLGAFAAASGWIGVALVTRQSYVWLGLLALVVLAVEARERGWLRSGEGRDRVALGIGVLALASLPFGALVLAWGGPVPPGGDPASCGICAPEAGRLGWRDASPLRSPLFALATLAVSGVLLHGIPALRAWLAAEREPRRAWVRTALVAGAIGAALLLIAPLARGTGDEGWLWRVARSGPEPLGTHLLFWLIVPLGCAVAGLLVRRDGARALPMLILITFLVAQLATRLPYQKYFDPFTLLVCALALRPRDLRRPADWLGPAAVVVLSTGYALAFILGFIAVES